MVVLPEHVQEKNASQTCSEQPAAQQIKTAAMTLATIALETLYCNPSSDDQQHYST
jgi:hypothetical protein